MEIRKPVFIIGSGRSGTTILYDLVALHPELCWFSNVTNRYPRFPALAVTQRLLDAPIIGDGMKRQLVQRTRPSIRPSEAERIYHTYAGFVDGRKMTEDEFTHDMADGLREMVRAHLRFAGKPRFLNKRTANTQRIELIAKIFPDAYYVHLIRDGRAVAASYYTVRWWKEIDIWWLGGKAANWEEEGRDPVELCGLQWQRNVKELLDHRQLFGDRYFELRYEELVQDPRDCIGRIAQFCELEWSTEYLEFIPKTLPNMNHKWQERFDEEQKEILQRTIGGFLEQLGYSA